MLCCIIRSKKQDVLIENVPVGICTKCGMHYYTADVLKRIEENLRGHVKQNAKCSCLSIHYDNGHIRPNRRGHFLPE